MGENILYKSASGTGQIAIMFFFLLYVVSIQELHGTSLFEVARYAHDQYVISAVCHICSILSGACSPLDKADIQAWVLCDYTAELKYCMCKELFLQCANCIRFHHNI